jgi:hypothetical protein
MPINEPLAPMITLLGNGSAILLHGRVSNADGGSMRPRYGAASDCVAPGCRRCSVRLTGESLGPFGYKSQSTPSGGASGSETTSLRRACNRGRAPRIVRARGARQGAMPSWVRFICRKKDSAPGNPAVVIEKRRPNSSCSGFSPDPLEHLEADVMPHAHDIAMQMIDTSIVGVPQHGACIAR